ncbi:hypothetical protein H8A99_02590 [Bradyrhizobium sp. Arg68]|uniref:hypothetical protein n=1 Tax=Bradyrhizobium ivorense TaxID=2511166 RepID=UPI001E555485|nr:hypothetical protein [Bradyrhizobium ivorense]MCC8935411.1 hypothetical protein [Bradyrhizobium ivorense]
MSGRGGEAIAGGLHAIGADTGPRYVTELADGGWLVEIHLIEEREPDSRFFAVGTRDAGEAEEAILRYPGIVREDKRKARRRLSDEEIACLGLRPDGVRPYILGPSWE